MREFPPRLIQQPIFYPVLNLKYARRIAREWNTPDTNSGFAGFVTKFEVSTTYLSKFEIHTAGSKSHREYWIPAREMKSFNKAISGLIRIEEAFFGPEFAGHIPDEHALKGLSAAEQFTALSKILDRPEFAAEVSANRKAVFLNCIFWLHGHLSGSCGNREQRESFAAKLVTAWEANRIGVPLPI